MVSSECPNCHAQEYYEGADELFAVFADEDAGYPFHRTIWCCEVCGHVGSYEDFRPPVKEKTGQKLLF